MVTRFYKLDMKNFYRLTYLSVLAALIPATMFAGNGERAGSGGATELLINPWARSSGFGGFNSSSARGVEAMNLNIGGLAFTKKTEVVFSRTNWLKGSDVSVNSFGLSQRVSSDGVLGVSIFSMNFGDIDVTTNDKPEGNVGKFSPQLINFAVAYAKEFSNSIHGGVLVRGIQQTMADIKSAGFSIDAGIQYCAGDLDQLKLGISLRNIGPDMQMAGDGIMATFTDPTLPFAVEGYRKSQAYQLPSLLNLGLSYDFYVKKDHRLSVLGNFTSNAFSNDQIGFGAEYAYKKYLMLRGGYNAQSDISNKDLSPSVYTGVSCGATFEVPINDKGSTFGIDYSYSPSYVFDGTHVIGARITL